MARCYRNIWGSSLVSALFATGGADVKATEHLGAKVTKSIINNRWSSRHAVWLLILEGATSVMQPLQGQQRSETNVSPNNDLRRSIIRPESLSSMNLQPRKQSSAAGVGGPSASCQRLINKESIFSVVIAALQYNAHMA